MSKNLHSDSWCPLPFNAISFHPTGKLTRCMMSNTSMGNSYDSAEMQQLRQDMLDGKWDKEGCMSCWKKEEKGNISQRQKWLQRNPEDFLSTQGYLAPKLTGNPVNHMFINYSNVCNFKCRMCSPQYSNSLIPEHKYLNSIGLGKKVKYDENVKNFNPINQQLKDNPSLLEHCNSIWITGGEPFIDNSCYELADILHDNNKMDGMDIVITTNGSKLNFDKLQTFEDCKFFEIDLSIDAPGPMFEYMRSNGVFTWKQMQDLLDDLKHFRKQNSNWFNVCLNSSIQAYNFDTVIELNEICLDIDAKNNTRLLVFPDYFRLEILPLNIREQQFKILQQYPVFDDARFERTLQDVCKNMLNPQADNNLVEKFKTMTKEQDKFRNVFLYDYHTQLGDFVYG